MFICSESFVYYNFELCDIRSAEPMHVNQITRLFRHVYLLGFPLRGLGRTHHPTFSPLQFPPRLGLSDAKAVTGTDCRSCEFVNTEENMFCLEGMDSK